MLLPPQTPGGQEGTRPHCDSKGRNPCGTASVPVWLSRTSSIHVGGGMREKTQPLLIINTLFVTSQVLLCSGSAAAGRCDQGKGTERFWAARQTRHASPRPIPVGPAASPPTPARGTLRTRRRSGPGDAQDRGLVGIIDIRPVCRNRVQPYSPQFQLQFPFTMATFPQVQLCL